jgi:hypothetical protein
MNRSIFIIVVGLISSFTGVGVQAEAIDPINVGYFQLSEVVINRRVVVQKAPTPKTVISKSEAPQMPAPLKNVVPASAPLKTNSGKNPPAGVLPIAIDPVTGKAVALLGYEQGNVKGFSDFGGSGDSTDISREHTAVREFNEETCLAFWEDLTNTPLNRATASKTQLETLATQPLTQNVIPWFYAANNNYLTCLLPVRYQSVADINNSMSVVRKKVKASPFFEKTEFAWVPLEDLVSWIENGLENPAIPNGKGKPVSWRFLGRSLGDFKDLNNTGFDWLYDRVIKYLKDIVTLNS